MSTSLLLCHLGESIPLYIKECVHQLRLWNSVTDLRIFLILDPCHKSTLLFQSLTGKYGVEIVYTDTLEPTQHHTQFLNEFSADLQFRKGYWRYTKERFYYQEELLRDYHLSDCFVLEYDVLVYSNLKFVAEKLRNLPKTVRYVMDNQERGHPGCMFIPSIGAFEHMNRFLTEKSKEVDMTCLSLYAQSFPERVRTFPVLPTSVQKKTPIRISRIGKQETNTEYLSTDFESLHVLWDSACIGQWVGGIDSRNTNGLIVRNFENESSMYSMKEMNFQWKKSEDTYLWIPTLDGFPVCTIHMHSKALKSFLSDRKDIPRPDYDGIELYESLMDQDA